MGKDFKSPRQLEAYLAKVMDNIIRNEVFDAIVEIWLDKQLQNVYESYTPKQYERRYEAGGLADPRNIEMELAGQISNTTVYVIENMTEGDGWDSFKGQKINDLIEGKDGFAGDPAKGMPARPYTEETVDIINSHPQEIKEAFRQGFARHKLNISI